VSESGGSFYFSFDGLDGNEERPYRFKGIKGFVSSEATLIYEDGKLIGGTFASTLTDIQNLPEVREP
jgi:hypothetical protein